MAKPTPDEFYNSALYGAASKFTRLNIEDYSARVIRSPWMEEEEPREILGDNWTFTPDEDGVPQVFEDVPDKPSTSEILPTSQYSIIYKALDALVYFVKNGLDKSTEYFYRLLSMLSESTRDIYLIGNIFSGIETIYGITKLASTITYQMVFSRHPNTVGVAAGILYGTLFGRLAGSFLGSALWIDGSKIMAGLYNVFSLGNLVPVGSTVGAIVGSVAIGSYLAPTFGEFLGQFGLGPKTMNIYPEIEEKTKSFEGPRLFWSKKALFMAASAGLLGFYLVAPTLAVTLGARAVANGFPGGAGTLLSFFYSVYNVVFAWIPSGFLSLQMLLLLPDMFSILINGKRGNFGDALTILTSRCIISGIMGNIFTWGFTAPIKPSYIQEVVLDKIVSGADPTAALVKSAVNAADYGTALLGITEKTKEFTKSFASFENADIKSVGGVIRFMGDLVYEFMRIVSNNSFTALVCGFLVAAAVLSYRLRSRGEHTPSINQVSGSTLSSAAECVTTLMQLQRLLLDFCNVSEAPSKEALAVITAKFKKGVALLKGKCPRIEKNILVDVYHGLDYIGILTRAQENFTQISQEVLEIIDESTDSEERKDPIREQVRELHNYTNSRFEMRIATLTG